MLGTVRARAGRSISPSQAPGRALADAQNPGRYVSVRLAEPENRRDDMYLRAGLKQSVTTLRWLSATSAPWPGATSGGEGNTPPSAVSSRWRARVEGVQKTGGKRA